MADHTAVVTRALFGRNVRLGGPDHHRSEHGHRDPATWLEWHAPGDPYDQVRQAGSFWAHPHDGIVPVVLVALHGRHDPSVRGLCEPDLLWTDQDLRPAL